MRGIAPASNGQEIDVVSGTTPATAFDTNLNNNVISESTAASAQGTINATDQLTFIFGDRSTYDDIHLQKAFGLLNANIGVGPSDGRWRLGVFAINLLYKR